MKEQEYVIKKAKSFEPKHIFECGQCFRWNIEKDGSYTGVVGNNVLNVKKANSDIIITGMCEKNIKELCKEYFDLDTNYEVIKETLSQVDNNLKISIKYGQGIRILNQDTWEALISFIISANNNIPRIKGIIERISQKYGKEISWKNKEYYTFPTSEELSRASVADLRELGLGFRDVRVFETTRMVNNKIIDIYNLEKIKETNKLRDELLKYPGVGPKVADCIMLFSMKRLEVFPIDVWVKRVMTELYGNEINKCGGKASNLLRVGTEPYNGEKKNISKKINPNNKLILKFAQRKFGKIAGLAQQYLFYWRRELEKRK